MDVDCQNLVAADQVLAEDRRWVRVVNELQPVGSAGLFNELKPEIAAENTDRVIDIRRRREGRERRGVRRHFRLGDRRVVRIRRGGIAQSREV